METRSRYSARNKHFNDNDNNGDLYVQFKPISHVTLTGIHNQKQNELVQLAQFLGSRLTLLQSWTKPGLFGPPASAGGYLSWSYNTQYRANKRIEIVIDSCLFAIIRDKR